MIRSAVNWKLEMRSMPFYTRELCACGCLSLSGCFSSKLKFDLEPSSGPFKQVPKSMDTSSFFCMARFNSYDEESITFLVLGWTDRRPVSKTDCSSWDTSSSILSRPTCFDSS